MTSLFLVGDNRIIPIAIELIGFEIDSGHLFCCRFNRLWVFFCIQNTMNFQSSISLGSRNEINNSGMSQKRLTTPILGDERKESMFNLIPSASPRRKMTDGNRHPNLISQLLQFPFPEASTRTIATTAISGNHQRAGIRISFLSQSTPPSSNSLNGKCSCIMIDSNTDPTNISFQIINSIGNRFAFILIWKIMDVDFF